MRAVVSLLRAVNLAGHNRVNMDELRTMCERLGLCDVQTYIQSGNVVFRTDQNDLPKLAARIEKAIERACGFRPAVILRTPNELRNVIADNPFAARRDIVPQKLAVLFLAAGIDAEARRKLLAIDAGTEELRIGARELYIYFPNGMGRPKLSMAAVDKALASPSTARNWNTVTKLLQMAEKLEAAG